jgi:MFS family permease
VAELQERGAAAAAVAPQGRVARIRQSALAETLGIRAFRFYWTSTFFYFLAFGTQRFVFVWLVLELSDNSGLAGVTGFALGIPAFFITLPAGAYADRMDRRRMVVGANIAGGLVSLAIAALIWTDVITVGLAITMALATGVTTAATQPPLMALIPTLVPRERLMNGIVLRTMGQNLAMVLGASVGGVVIDIWDIGGSFAILTVAYVLSTLAMMRVRSQASAVAMPSAAGPSAGPSRNGAAGGASSGSASGAGPSSNGASGAASSGSASGAGRPPLLTSVREGLVFIYRNPGLLGLVVLLASMGLVMLGPVFVLVPQIAKDDLGQSATGASILFAITSVGMFLMSVVLASMSDLRHKGALLLITLMIGGVIVAGIGASQWYAVTAVMMFLWGLGGGIIVNLNQTLAQTHTPDEMMGRVMSVVALAIAGMMPLGMLAAGGGSVLTGAGEWLILCGAVLTLLGVVMWVRLPALRTMD